MSLAVGAYFFLIAFFLAHLEIQIEGPHGWAEKLPTWRWDGPGVRRWLGKPVTVIVTAFTLHPRRRVPAAARGVQRSAKVTPK